MPVIALWAHSRSASTAFLRMMIERGDVAVLHEPFLALTQGEPVAVPGRDGSSAVARSGRELMDSLAGDFSSGLVDGEDLVLKAVTQ